MDNFSTGQINFFDGIRGLYFLNKLAIQSYVLQHLALDYPENT